MFSADLFAIFQSNLLGQLHVVQPPRLTVPFVWFREFELDYGYLVTPYLSQKISGREIVGVWKLARLVTAD